jgi:hypothetical protein
MYELRKVRQVYWRCCENRLEKGLAPVFFIALLSIYQIGAIPLTYKMKHLTKHKTQWNCK